MLKHVEEAVWNDAATLHSRKPVPDSVRCWYANEPAMPGNEPF